MNDAASVEIDVAELAARREAGDVQLVDVRTDEEWAEGRIAGSRHVEMNELTRAAESIDREQPVVFVCSAGNRSAVAAEAFRTAGFDAYSLTGGLEEWGERGQELESA